MNWSFSRHKFSVGKILVAIILTAALAMPAKPAAAGTASGTILVTATVITACLIGTSGLAFGNYDPTATGATTASTSVTATCTSSAPYTIALNNGVGTGADATAGASGRKMTIGSGTATLGYNLYTDNAYSNYWATSSPHYQSGTGNGAQQSYTIYGRIPAQQTAIAGSYTDTVTATLSF